MKELIERLRAAEEGSRELDLAIAVALDSQAEVCAQYADWQPHALTTSLDDALRLVPEGWQWDAGTFAPDELICPGGAQAAVHDHRYSDRYAHAEAATPALAIVIATLTARQEMEDG